MLVLRYRRFQPKPKIVRLGLNVCALTSALALFCWHLLPLAFPVDTRKLAGPAPSVLILDRNQQPLHHQVRSDYLRSEISPLDEIPELLIQATLAAEDKRFFRHAGVDILATLRSARDSLNAGRFVSGGSTITQQTVKLITDPAPRTLETKAIEALRARRVEMFFDKRTILASYFNHLEYGNLTQGPRQASLHYFGKELDQLSLAQTALLAGLPQAPSRHNPRRNPDSAKQRRDWVLDRLSIVYGISSDRIQRAKSEPIQLISRDSRAHTPQLAALVLPHRVVGKSTIATTIDSSLQAAAQTILTAEVHKLRNQHVQNGAVVILDNHSRQILALVGSAKSDAATGNQINAALVPRSPGSALKPFTYLLAFENLGYSPATIIPDIPTQYAGVRGPESFVNYDRTFSGPVTIQQALGSSLNVPAVRVLNQLGGPRTLHTALQNLGITTLDQPSKHYGLGLTLGSGEVSLLEIANAFTSIANLGSHRPYQLILHQRPAEKTQLFSPESCYLTASIMADNLARASSFGARSDLRLPFPCAVKTGTSSDFRDNFCVGFTADYTVAVWVGNLNNQPMRGISGVTGAAPIFHSLMLHLHKDKPPNWLEMPSSIAQVSIDPHTGKQIPSDHHRAPISVKALALKNNLPKQHAHTDYDAAGKVYLDQQYDAWLPNHPQFAASHTRDRPPTLRVLSPAKGARYLLDPDLPDRGAYLPLISNAPDSTQWICSTLQIINHHGTPTLVLQPGEHEILATQKSSSQKRVIRFSVKEL